MSTTVHPKATDLTLDVMRRKARVQTQIFDIIDKLPIAERIEILEEMLEALDEADPSSHVGDFEPNGSAQR